MKWLTKKKCMTANKSRPASIKKIKNFKKSIDKPQTKCYNNYRS